MSVAAKNCGVLIKKIPATLRQFGRSILHKLRTCAYARVSTEKEEQESSYERQVGHYTKLINSKTEWSFAGIYADPGITGTKAKKRPDFMRMIEDCRAGKIDKILCKSVQRFARNTVEALTYIRELKELGISIFFECEGIDTLTPGGEVLITILAGMAEQEVRNISMNIKWAYKKKFDKGEIVMSTKNFLGYTRDADNKIVIEPSEAIVVRRIFREFLNGYPTAQIANRLMAEGVPSPTRRRTWYPSNIRSILRNEKYTGNAIMGKTYKPDVLSDKRVKNTGQDELFYISDSHPAIVSQETYDIAQAELSERCNERSARETGNGRYSRKHSLSGFMLCESCGAKMRRWYQGYGGGREKIATWVCIAKQDLKTCCEQPVKEDLIKNAFLTILNGLLADKEEFVASLKSNIHSELNDELLLEIAELDAQIAEQQEEVLRLNKENRFGTLSNLDYEVAVAGIEVRLNKLNKTRDAKVLRVENIRLLEFRLKDIERVIDDCTELKEFDEFIFTNLVDIIVATRRKATFRFRFGLDYEFALSA